MAGRPREPKQGRRGVSPKFEALVRAHRWEGKRVLDIGCGTGAATVLAAKLGADAVGVDIDAAVLVEANERAKEERAAHARFLCADVEFVDFGQIAQAPGGLDGVLAHLCFSEEIAKRAAKALRPGGAFIVRSFHKDMWKEAGEDSPFSFSSTTLRALMKRLGLTVTHLEVERRTQEFDSFDVFVADFLWDEGRRAQWQEDGRLETMRKRFGEGKRTLSEAFLVFEATKTAAARNSARGRVK
jgi:SAM-dependent methyltransferase